MAIKRDKVQAGMRLYDRHRYTAGNTTIRALGEWDVVIVKVEDRGCEVRWNGNPPRFWAWRQIEKLYTWSMYDETEAEITEGFGGVSRCKRLPKAERMRRKAERERLRYTRTEWLDRLRDAGVPYDDAVRLAEGVTHQDPEERRAALVEIEAYNRVNAIVRQSKEQSHD